MDKPNVLTLSPLEWKALTLQRMSHLGQGLAEIMDHLQKQTIINKPMIAEINSFYDQMINAMHKHWGEVELPLQGWERASRPIIAEHEAQQLATRVEQRQEALDQDRIAVVSQQNPVTASLVGKRKGGWPKGRKRVPKSPTPSAAALPPVSQ